MVKNISVDLSAERETISDAFNKVNQASRSVSSSLDDIQQDLEEVAKDSNIADESLEELSKAGKELKRAQEQASAAGEKLEDTFEKLEKGSISASEAKSRYNEALDEVRDAQSMAERSGEKLSDKLIEIARNTEMSDRMQERLGDTIAKNIAVVSGYAERLDEAGDEAWGAAAGNQAFASSVNRVNRSVTKANANMAVANSQMGLLGTLAQKSSLEFGSLSLNVGSFNIALKQLSLQIPAILVGMGAWIALLSSLAAGLMTAVTAMGAFIGAGFVGYLEQVENQNEEVEDTMQALMVVMDSVGDLFYEALQPIMQEGDVNLFIAAVEKAAEVLNVIAQWLAANKETFTDFWSEASFNLEVFLNSMLKAFKAIEPHLIALINYLGDGLPRAIASFAEISANLLPHIREIIGSIRTLFNELIGFASIVLTGVTPVIVGLVGALSTFFSIVNSIPSSVLALGVMLATVGLVAGKVAGALVSVYSSLVAVKGAIVAAATSGSALGGVMVQLGGISKALAAGNLQSVSQAVQLARASMGRFITSIKSTIASKLALLKTTGATVIAFFRMAGAAAKSAAMTMLSATTGWTAAGAYSAMAGAATAAAASIKGLGRSAYKVVAALMAKAVAAGISTIAVAALTVATKALLAALGIGLILAVASALWKLVSGGEGAAGMMDRLGGAVEYFKQIVSEFITPIVNIFYSLFGLLKGLTQPWFALAEALGITSSKGGDSASTLSKIGDALVFVARAIATPLRLFETLLRIFTAIVTGPMTNWFRRRGQEIAKFASWLWDLIPATQYVAEGFGIITGAIHDVIDAIKWLMESGDRLESWAEDTLGIEVGDKASETKAARDEQEKDKQEEEDTTQYEPNVNMSFEDRVEQNVDVQADPEEKETMSRLVKDAMNEANSIERRRQGR